MNCYLFNILSSLQIFKNKKSKQTNYKQFCLEWIINILVDIVADISLHHTEV